MTELDLTAGTWTPRAPAAMTQVALATSRIARAAALVARSMANERIAQTSDGPLVRAWRNQAASRAMCEAHTIEARVTGALPAQPAILVANHLSYIDPMVIGSLVACVGVAKAEVAGWPVIGARLRDLGVMFVRRGDAYSGARVLRGAMAALRDGASVLNFPEGTTSYGDDVLPFHRGIFAAAWLTGTPIIPVHLSYDDRRVAWVGDETFLPHYITLARRERVIAHVHFCAPIEPRAYETPGAIASRARDAVLGRASS
jgi:1-acyl-sn-glycerol-3-phosphate acyltransferase